jgi:hypothetical protein
LGEEDEDGQCRRYPPTVDVIGPEYPTWPVTDCNDFCGEWRDNSITPQHEQRVELVEKFALAIVQGIYANPKTKETDSSDIWSVAELMVDVIPKIGGES